MQEGHPSLLGIELKCYVDSDREEGERRSHRGSYQSRGQSNRYQEVATEVTMEAKVAVEEIIAEGIIDTKAMINKVVEAFKAALTIGPEKWHL